MDMRDVYMHHADSKNIKDFRKIRSSRAVIAIVKEWFLVFITIFICSRADLSIVSFLGILFIATRMFALTELTHEATHGNLFKTKKVHYWLEFFYSWPVFVDLKSYAPGHLRHHAKMNNLNEDPSTFWLKREGLFRSLNKQQLFWILVMRPLLGYQAYRELLHMKYYFTQFRSFRLKLVSFWLFILGFCIYFKCFDLLFIYWILPFFWLATTFRFWKEVEDHYNTERGVRNVIPHKIYAFFLNPYSCGNHYLHHKEPHIPWYNMDHALQVVDIPKKDTSRNFLDTYRQVTDFQNRCNKWPFNSIDEISRQKTLVNNLKIQNF